MGNIFRPIQKWLLAALGSALLAGVAWLTKAALDEAKEVYGWHVLPWVETVLTFLRVATLFAAAAMCALAAVVWWFFQLDSDAMPAPTTANFAGGPVSRPPRLSKRTYLDPAIRPIDLNEKLLNRTNMQARATAQPYVGK